MIFVDCDVELSNFYLSIKNNNPLLDKEDFVRDFITSLFYNFDIIKIEKINFTKKQTTVMISKNKEKVLEREILEDIINMHKYYKYLLDNNIEKLSDENINILKFRINIYMIIMMNINRYLYDKHFVSSKIFDIDMITDSDFIHELCLVNHKEIIEDIENVDYENLFSNKKIRSKVKEIIDIQIEKYKQFFI